MIGPLANTRLWVAAGFTDMRCGFDGLAAKVQTALAKEPLSGYAHWPARRNNGSVASTRSRSYSTMRSATGSSP
jgi:hypothetical protein